MKINQITKKNIKMSFWKCFPCMRFQCDEVITKLDYSNCALTDVPPDVSQHERTLEELYLSSNRIRTVCPQLFYCQGIRVLFVNDNDLESLPNAIGSLRQLQNLNLSRNGLSTVPDNIKSCKNLTRLDLSLNNLQRLPNAITSLISLQELLLNETNLEFLPANFGRLVNLRILELRSNNLITLPKSMSRLSNLNRIDIGANEFTELPEVICQLTQLRELWIDVNRIRRISPNVSNLRELKHFEANNNLLLTLPNEISNWRNLEVLSISTNDMESLPFSIGMLKSLVTLQCEANQLRELPDSICHLENLEEMVISHNFILRLPSTIGMLRKLRFFCADENILRNLPVEICSCVNLAVLSIRSNKITELPQNIGHLVNLRVLNLVDNYITNLPVSVLSLTKLTALWISDNQSQPLVPLQYANTSEKTCLTCFMLPQQAYPPEEADQSMEYNGSCLTNAWLNQQKQDKSSGILAFNKKAVINPSQTIFFADDKSDSTFVVHKNSAANQSQGVFFTDGDTPKEHTFLTQSESVMSPSRRICFADEVKGAEMLATRLMRSPTPYPKELRLMAKYVRNNHQGQAQDIQFAQGMVETNEQAQRLVSLPSNSDEIDGKKYISKTSPTTTVNMASQDGVKEARVILNTGENSVLLQQVQNSANCHIINRNRSINVDDGDLPVNHLNNQISDHNNTQYFKRQQQGQSFIDSNNAIMKNSIANDINLSHQQKPMQSSSTDISGECLNTTKYANQAAMVAQQQYNQHYRNSLRQSAAEAHPDFSGQYYPHSPSMYDQQFRETLYEGSGSVRQISSSSSIISSYSQQGSQLIPNSTHSIQNNKPPPYHIARAFTKKSREDLLNYDTVRSKIHHRSETQTDAEMLNGAELDDQENTEEDRDDNKSEENVSSEYSVLNGHNSQIPRHTDNSLHSTNDNEYDFIDHHNNNNSKLKATYSLECENGLIKHHSLLSLQDVQNVAHGEGYTPQLEIYSSLSHRQQWNGDGNGMTENTCDALQEGKINTNSNPWRTPPRSSTWLFGLHKNPTVKQVAIKRDSQIGFDIQERPNQGIFVRGTHPNTSAATLLHANDKLLEVDGYDFTKICLVDAQQILDNSGPVINVMISRT